MHGAQGPSYGAAEYGQSYSMKPIYAESFSPWALLRSDLWPNIFTFCLCALFGPALITVYSAISEPSIRYWIGNAPYFFFLTVPILLLTGHVLHSCARRPKFYPSLFSSVVPAVFVIISGCLLLRPAMNMSDKLLAPDCKSFREKYELDEAWKAAAAIFDQCVTRVATVTQALENETAPLIKLTDCAEYKASLDLIGKYGSKWAYLQHLEEHDACTGWCTPGEGALFVTSHQGRDLCVRVAGSALAGEAVRLGWQLIILGILELLISIWAMGKMQALLKAAGQVW